LKPGETKSITFILGYQENPVNSKFDPPETQIINKKGAIQACQLFRKPGAVDRAFNEIHDFWTHLLEKLQVTTPDQHTNRMVNIWNAYQVMVTFNFSRSASYFESGVGRGMGFRDSNQDLLGFMHLIPGRARERILDLASTQLPDGGAYHQYQPLTKHGNHDIGSNFNDDPLWLILAAAAYLKETGDWQILKEPVPFDSQPGTEKSLYTHLQRSLQYTLDRLGPHGLPLIGRADWNDCLNLNSFTNTPGQSFQTTTAKNGKVAESVFIAGLFILAAREMETIAQRLGNPDESRHIQSARERIESVIGTAGWDGEWFRRAYDDFSQPVGSSDCEEGQIFIEPQGMCVMAGVGLADGKARLALDSVSSKLAGPHGIAILHPAYQQYYLHLGEISSYPPGYKENGSVFCHTNPWVMIAECRLGRGDKAFEYYTCINPSFREEISDIHRCEPYVYAQTISGYEAPHQGEAKNSWLTGTAAWNYVAITQWILGVRPDYDGLLVDPVFPSWWRDYHVQRTFRGVQYFIDIERIGPGNETSVIIDGRQLEGHLIPLQENGTSTVRVQVKVG
jgi:cellobiose phosphorylase